LCLDNAFALIEGHQEEKTPFWRTALPAKAGMKRPARVGGRYKGKKAKTKAPASPASRGRQKNNLEREGRN
jgi:hypothetical protein